MGYIRDIGQPLLSCIQKLRRLRRLATCAILATSITGFIQPATVAAETLSAEQVRAIAKEATVYGFPLVDNYRIQYSYFADEHGPNFKAPWNSIANSARVYTPEDKTIQSPNSDTPYSFLGADLRTEPLVLSVPPVDKGRYYAVQFIDLYTFNFAYAGSRTTGNGAGKFLLAGPEWKGTVPKGIKSVIRSDTDFAFVFYRTQLFNPGDIDNVKRIQAGYKVETLSQYLGKPAPTPAPVVKFIQPLTPQEERSSLQFFNVLNFVLQFCPTDPSEKALMERFAKIGVGAGKPFDANALAPEIQKAMQDGMADAWSAYAEFKKNDLDTGKISSASLFGTRAALQGNYLARMAGAAVGIYANTKTEAFYPVYFVDSHGEALNGSNRYTLHFPPGKLPPVHAFWSLTLYELPASLLYANELNRYLINSPMLPGIKRDADGGITLYIQHESPGPALESNWLPAPQGPFLTALRLYWPASPALDGQWKAPAMERVQQ